MKHSGGARQSRLHPVTAFPVGTLLREFRLAAGMTQEELAAAAGISARTISDLERGVRATPQAGPAASIAEALRLSPSERETWLTAVSSQRLPRTPHPRATKASDLPTEPGALLGRSADLAAIASQLTDGNRLVSLIGPGGVGKTRLALELAREREAAIPGSVVWVGLETVVSPADVLPAISRAVGAREGGGRSPLARIAEAIADRDRLLVVDNAEHVLDSAPDLAALVNGSPQLTALITSREALRVTGERVVVIDPLALPHPRESLERLADNPAVALYVRALGTDQVQQPSLREAAEVVRRLDGLPLAIELAAAQAAHLPPDAMVGLLDAAGLSALAKGRRDGPNRLRTMHAAIAWSLDLLPRAAERLLAILGVFHGGFTADAVTEVTTLLEDPDLVRQLPALINAQLVQRQSGAPARFRLLEPIRWFARERLEASGVSQDAERAHARRYLAWATKQIPLLNGPEPRLAMDAISWDLPNLTAAVTTAIAEHEAEVVLPVLTGLTSYFDASGYRVEHRAMLDAALATVQPPRTSAQLEAWFWSGYWANMLGDKEAVTRVIALLREETASSGDPQWGARANVLQWARDTGTPNARGVDLLWEGFNAIGDNRETEFGSMIAALLGVELQEAGNAEEALPLLEAVNARLVAERRALHLPVLQVRLGLTFLDLGRSEEAVPLFLTSLQTCCRLGLMGIATLPLLGLARVGAASADPAMVEAAALALGATEASVEDQGVVWGPYWEQIVTGIREAVGDRLGSELAVEVLTVGAHSSFEDLLDRWTALWS